MFIKTHWRGLCSATAFELLKATPHGDLFAANAGGFISILFIRQYKCRVEAGKPSCCFVFSLSHYSRVKRCCAENRGKNVNPNKGGDRLGTEVLGVAGQSAVKVSLALVELSTHSCFVPQFTCLQRLQCCFHPGMTRDQLRLSEPLPEAIVLPWEMPMGWGDCQGVHEGCLPFCSPSSTQTPKDCS